MLVAVDGRAVDFQDDVARVQTGAGGGTLGVDGGDEDARAFLPGETHEAAQGQPIDRVEGFAKADAGDPRGHADAELFDAHARELGHDEVAELVQDHESEQDADEGEDGIEHG